MDFWTQEWSENGKWRKLHNEELHNLYRPPNNIIFLSRTLKYEISTCDNANGSEPYVRMDLINGL